MKKLTGNQVYSLLEEQAERQCFNAWGRNVYEVFLAYIWKKASWANWYFAGYTDGALFLAKIRNMEEENTAEYQCLQHHFCLIDEATK